MGKHTIGAAILTMLLLLGCQEKGSDENLIEVAVEQEKQTGEIENLSQRVEGFDNRLVRIEQSLERLPEAMGAPDPAPTTEEETTEPKVVAFKDTPEYGDIAAKLSAIQEQLSLTQSSLVGTQEDIAREQELERLRDPAEAQRIMNDPQEMNRRLTLLAQNFVPTIQDPVTRQQFEVDVEQLKRSLSERPTTQQLYQQTVADLTERLNNEQNERAREFIQRQIESLETATSEELEGRLERYSRFGTMRQLRDFQAKYDIPREVYTNSGLPSMGMDRRGFRRGDRGGRPGGGGRQ